MSRMSGCLLLVVGLASGCKQGLPKMPDLSEVLPKVRFKELKVTDISFKKLDTKFVLEIDNPYPLGLSLTEKTWTLGLSGNPFLDGTDTDGVEIEPTGTSPVRIPVSMKWADAFQVASGLNGQDQIPFDLHADLGFSTPVGDVKVPFDHSGQMPALHTPRVSLKGLRVDKIDLLKQTASLALDVELQSEQASALSFDTFAWDLELNGSGVAEGTANIGALEGTRVVTLPIDLKLLGLGAAVLEAVNSKGSLKVGLKADANVGTPFGLVPLAINESAQLQLK